MIILLTGPTGVGKTDVSWALVEKSKDLTFLDCDWFASRLPFNWNNARDLESVFQALSIMIDYNISIGNLNFVIPLTIQMARNYSLHSSYFTKHKLSIHKYRLRCDISVLEYRIQSRHRIEAQKKLELKNMVEAQAEFDRLFSDDEIFQLIDTTYKQESEVAKSIMLLSDMQSHFKE